MKHLKRYKERKVLYCAVVLTEKSKNVLLDKISNIIDLPTDWKIFAHHMTIKFGKSLSDLGLNGDENEIVDLTVTKIGISDMAIAVGVEGYKSYNDNPHITIAINTNKGGKPIMSNDIVDWKQTKPFKIKGTVENLYCH